MADFGYDISDYRDVDPIFGTLADLDRLIKLRRREPALAVGDYAPLPATGHVIAYERHSAGRRFAVLLNLAAEAVTVGLSEIAGGRIVLGTSVEREGEVVDAGPLNLGGNEGVIVELATTAAGPRQPGCGRRRPNRSDARIGPPCN